MNVFAKFILAIIVFVLVAGIILLISARGDLESFSEAYELVVVDTWSESVFAIVTAFIAYIVGDRTAKTLDNRNRLKYGKSAGNEDLGKLDLNKL